jgi:S-phase kinase-associated protein 1
MFEVLTNDLKIFQLDENYVSKSLFFQNILSFPASSEPIQILINSNTLDLIYEFMKKDNHVLQKNFNPLEINFSSEFLNCFDHLSLPDLVGVCNAANYLEYPFLFELTCKQLSIRVSQNPELMDSGILGDGRVTDEDFDRITNDFEWLSDNL